MGVKKQMDTFFASLGEQTGRNGRLVNTPMGPFRWNDVMELWENVNNGMVLNNISFMDEFAMMDYDSTLGGGGGENKLILAILDLNFLTGSLDPRITFRRTSLGSFIGSNGTLKFSDVNLFWDTEQIGGNTWYRDDAAFIPGSTSYILGPAGVTNGFRFSVRGNCFAAVRTQTNANFAPQIISGITYTQSWYIKGDTGSQFRFFYVNGGTGNTVWVNLLKGSTTGTPQTYVSTATNANIDLTFDLLYSATAWTEIKAELRTTGSMGGSNIPLFYLTSISAPAGITKTIDVAEPMLYPFSGSKSYIPSPQDGPYGGPRFEYSITGETLGLLVEQQATNRALALDGPAGWGRSNVNFYPLAATAAYSEVGPDNNISGVVFTSSTNSLSILPQSSWPHGTGQTTNRSFSLWMKGWCGNTVAAIGFSGHAPIPSIDNVTTTLYGPGSLTKGLTAGNLLAYVQITGLSTNAWSRVTISATGGSVTPFENYIIYPIGDRNYSDSATRGIIAAYPQLESGLIPSSTIFASWSPSVTRGQDIVSIAGSSFTSWFSSNSDGTVIATVVPGTTGNFASNNYIWSINNSATTNTIRQLKGATSNNLLSSYVVAGTGITIPTLTNVFTQGSVHKVALGWSVGTGGLFAIVNGTGGTSGNLIGATYPSGLNRMSIGVAETLSGSNFQGHIQRIQYFNQKLSDSDIANRTT